MANQHYNHVGQATQWQPIETAPSGTLDDLRDPAVLVWAPGEVMRVAIQDDNGWYRAEGQGGDLVYVPTHWAPLPEPPTSETNRTGGVDCQAEPPVKNHTAGSWKMRPNVIGVTGTVITTEDGMAIATVYPTSISGGNSDNARLVAAAPELLDALVAIYEAFPDCSGGSIQCRSGHPVFESAGAGLACMKAREAIAKATDNAVG